MGSLVCSVPLSPILLTQLSPIEQRCWKHSHLCCKRARNERIMEGSWTTYHYDRYPYCPAVVHLRQCQGRLQAAPPTTTRDARKLETQIGSSPINVWLDFKNDSCMCENFSVRKKLRDLYMSV